MSIKPPLFREKAKPKISVCIPTRKRIASLRQCLDSLIGMARWPDTIEICLRLHRDDHETIREIPNLLRYDAVKIVIAEPYVCHGCLWEDAYAIATGVWVWQMQDDAYVTSADWDLMFEGHENQYLMPNKHFLNSSLYENDKTSPFIATRRDSVRAVVGESFRYDPDYQFLEAYSKAGYEAKFVPITIHHDRLVHADGTRDAEEGLTI